MNISFDRLTMMVCWAAWLGLALISGCASAGSDVATLSGEPSRSVTQGGPQDIGEFRKVATNGGVPAPELLDEVGFFAEHAIALPDADCGEAVCVHPMLGVAPRFDGGNWSMAFVGLNTAVDPSSLVRKPRHLILIVERTLATHEVMPEFAAVGQAIAGALLPEDRVSLIFAHASPIVELSGESPDALLLPSAELPDWPMPGTTTDAYAAFVGAGNIARLDGFSERFSQRILWFTSGTLGSIRSRDRYEALARDFAEAGIAISVFGMGRSYVREVPSAVAEIASGNYYFAESREDLLDALEVEAKTAFVPLARAFELSVEARPGYRIGRVYGARRALVTENSARLRTPTLFIGARVGETDVTSGRRGGGGGFFVELLADERPDDDRPRVPAEAFTLTARYEDATSGELVEQSSTLSTPLGVGQNPPMDAPFFSDPARAKPFMTLNMYLALRAQVTLFQAGECGSALGIENMMAQSHSYWKQVYDDPDIDADFSLVMTLSDVMLGRCSRVTPAPPLDFGGGCFMF